MAKVTVLSPDEIRVREFEIGPGEGLLVGRDPDDTSVAGREQLKRITSVVIPDASVSANHCLAWVEGDSVWIEDLGSRNGTWASVPGRHPVKLPAEPQPCIRLSDNGDELKAGDEPADAKWSDSRDYARAVEIAVRAWLLKQRVEARVVVLGKAQSRPGGSPGQIPLAAGGELQVVADETLLVSGQSWSGLLERLWRYVQRQNGLLRAEEETREEGQILASEGIREAHRQVVDAAEKSQRAVILGPTGAGKEGLARTYHRLSGLSGPFVAINCSMIQRERFQVELFGAEKGSFTSSTQRIVGAVEQANGGTLFLDEVADIPPEVQPMLLRFLDRGDYERLGSPGQTQRTDARIVCATNKDLKAAVARGQFRADLWYRLATRIIEVPPLHKRAADVTAFLQARKLRSGLTAWEALSPEARDELARQPWKGNFRELKSFVERLEAGEPGGIDLRACREALHGTEQVSMPTAPSTTEASASGRDWNTLGALAAQAFRKETGLAAPSSWDEATDYVERYLKPLLLAHLAGISDLPPGSPLPGSPLPGSPLPGSSPGSPPPAVAHVAAKVKADRGTVRRQLERYGYLLSKGLIE